MAYAMFTFLFGMVFGLVGVSSHPSPFFAALGLVVVAGMAGGLLLEHGGPFLSLVLFLIYLGGMLVVFAYSAALAAEPFPESWINASVALYMAVYLLGLFLVAGAFWGGWYDMSWTTVDDMGEYSMFLGDMSGVATMYSEGGSMLVLGAWVLLITLLVVLEVTRGLGRGTVRAI